MNTIPQSSNITPIPFCASNNNNNNINNSNNNLQSNYDINQSIKSVLSNAPHVLINNNNTSSIRKLSPLSITNNNYHPQQQLINNNSNNSNNNTNTSTPKYNNIVNGSNLLLFPESPGGIASGLYGSFHSHHKELSRCTPNNLHLHLNNTKRDNSISKFNPDINEDIFEMNTNLSINSINQQQSHNMNNAYLNLPPHLRVSIPMYTALLVKVTPECVSMIECLLDVRPHYRIGAGKEIQIKQMKQHEWFQLYDWNVNKLEHRVLGGIGGGGGSVENKESMKTPPFHPHQWYNNRTIHRDDYLGGPVIDNIIHPNSIDQYKISLNNQINNNNNINYTNNNTILSSDQLLLFEGFDYKMIKTTGASKFNPSYT